MGQPESVIDSSEEEDGTKPKPKKTADRIDEMLLSEQIKAKKAAGDVGYKRMSRVPARPSKTQADDEDDKKDDKDSQKISKTRPPKPEEKKSASTMTEQISPDILNLARNNDLNVATIARQVNKSGDNDEVVISLH